MENNTDNIPEEEVDSLNDVRIGIKFNKNHNLLAEKGRPIHSLCLSLPDDKRWIIPSGAPRDERIKT